MNATATYTLKQPIPVLNVRDLQEALDFFTQRLGFGEPWLHEGYYGGISKDGQQIHLAKADVAKPSMIYNFVDSVDALYSDLKSAGVEIETEIQDQFYGMRDFTIKDPSGNSIGFGAQISQ